MAIQDWTKVDAGIFHAFHLQWIAAISNALNNGILPSDYYALPEQRSGIFGPDVLTLERVPPSTHEPEAEGSVPTSRAVTSTLLATPPKIKPIAETPADFYHRKQNSVTVRHVSDDRMVAVVEIISPGNKSSVARFRSFIEKAAALLLNDIHLLIVDLFPPGRRDPAGVHGAIWDDIAAEAYRPPLDKPLAAISYEASAGVRVYLKHMAVGDPIPDMPLFLKSDACVSPQLDATYQTAFGGMPHHWREILTAH